LGAAVAPAEGLLVQPFTICVTVYVPADTVIGLIVWPVFHENEAPGSPIAVNKEVPQLSATDIPGAEGIDFGAAGAIAEELLVQPFTVWVTV
jgi:hypothetical protein